jgi:hypothetical protein
LPAKCRLTLPGLHLNCCVLQEEELLPSGERVYYDDYGTRYVVDDEKRTVRKVGTESRMLIL